MAADHVDAPPKKTKAGAPRRKRDRARTEADLLSAALRLLHRNGVLAGLSLQEVSAPGKPCCGPPWPNDTSPTERSAHIIVRWTSRTVGRGCSPRRCGIPTG